MFFFKSVSNTWPTNCAKIFQVMERKVYSVSMTFAPLRHPNQRSGVSKNISTASREECQPVPELSGWRHKDSERGMRWNGDLRFAFSLASVAFFLLTLSP